MDSSTDVSSAQSFDVSSFLGSLMTAGAGAIATKLVSSSQQTGQPSATVTPNVRAVSPAGSGTAAAGMSSQTLALVGVGVAVLVAVMLLRK